MIFPPYFFQYQEYFTIKNSANKTVHVVHLPMERQPNGGIAVEVWGNGLKLRQNVDYFRNANDRKAFFFPAAIVGSMYEIEYWSAD